MKRIGALILLAISLQACRKQPNINPPPIPPVNQIVGVSDTLMIDLDHPVKAVPPMFEGLSFEAWQLCRDPGYLNPNNTAVINMLKNLGPGVLRIGGNSSDETGWTGRARGINTSIDSLTTTDIDKLSAFSAASGWPVMFGLNMGTSSSSDITDEAVYVSGSLGANLVDLQLGNEPDYFRLGYRPTNYSVSDYQKEWAANYSAIRKLLPQVPFAGPDVANNLGWLNTFTSNYGDKVNLVDIHYYVDGPATESYINYQTILTPDSNLPHYFQTINNTATQAGVGYRITETNSIWGGGKKGVSDAFAGTLWALDFMWNLAKYNGQGINFHGGDNLVYSPILKVNGVWTAKPVYYAMLAFRYGSNNGTMVPVEASNPHYNCSAFACIKPNNTYTITIINKELNKDIYFTVQTSKTATDISIMRLQAPSITATENIRFAGSTVSQDGTFTPGAAEQKHGNQKSFLVTVPAGSAAVVTVN